MAASPTVADSTLIAEVVHGAVDAASREVGEADLPCMLVFRWIFPLTNRRLAIKGFLLT